VLPAAQEHILAQQDGKPRLLRAVTETSAPRSCRRSWLPLLSLDPQIEGAGQRFRHDSWLLLLMTVEVLSPGSQDVRDR
jgi:hypothetical protein